MARQQWFGSLVVGASLGVLGCGEDARPGVLDAGDTDIGSTDLGAVDTGRADTGAVDAGNVDAGNVDTGNVDTGAVDTGAVDTGAVDTGLVDSGVTDTGTPDAGTPDVGTPDSGAPITARTMPTHGSAVVLTSDDLFAVATNRTANTIRVFSTTLNPSTGAPTATPVGTDIATPDGEPWAAVIGNDDNTAYVILRHTQELVRVSNLRTAPAILAGTGRITVGSEPTGLAISPTGRHVYVANWANGTVSDVDVSGATMTIVRTIDLNAALAAAPGAPLGPSVTAAAARPGLAHPRAIVVTNDGDADDADETVYVTEFFAQYVAPGTTLPSGEARLDVERRGLVYRFNAGTGVTGDAINLQPFATTSAATEAGCFPNQLYAAAIKGDRLFVTSVCESPRRPVNPQQNVFAAISLVNTTTNVPDTANHVLLTRAFQDRYAATATAVPDGTNARRFPLIPNDIAFVSSSNVAYVSSYGSDAVFRVQFNADFTVNQVGQGTAQHFIDLGGFSAAPGRLPIGIAISNTATPRAVALNENSRSLSLINLNDQAVVAGVAAAPAPAAGRDTDNNVGRRFFVTGLGRWSLNGQGWGSCEGCHPDGLTDNVTWTFAAGPRQTTSLDGSFDRSGNNQRVFNWTGILDEVHDFEANTRGTSGGVGALVHRSSMPIANTDRLHFDGTTPVPMDNVATATPQAGLSGSTRAITAGTPGAAPVRSTLRDWEEIDLYVRTIRPPRAPNNLVAADVAAGRQLFINRNCGACHGSATGTNLWTVSRRFYDPNEANNSAMGLLRTRTYTGFPTALAALNPATSAGAATFRILPATITAQGAGGGDQISCAMRAVGTIGGTTMAPTAVAPSGVAVFELRANGMAAMGVTGFNPPSLVGMGTGAPFFHAGNARTLEEVFDNLFRAHHQTLAANFLDPTDTMRPAQIRQLVAFLVSIDDDTMPVAFPTGITGLSNVDLCSGFTP